MIRLLLVDNDRDILELLKVGLETMGHSVRTAESGLAALRAIEEELPDVLITDLIMPNISGEKLLKIVRAVPEWNNLKTIVISGVAAEAPELRQSILCDIYIAKGPIASTLKYLKDSIEHFERMRVMSATAVVGIEEIHSRHITRELLDFKAEIDSVVNQITDGICRTDRNGTILWMNRAFSTLMSLPEEKILGGDLLGLLDEQDRPEFRRFLENNDRTTREVQVELDGSHRLIRATRLTPPSADDPFVTILWQDVTDRLLSEEHYENIVESTSDLIMTTDLEGRINYVSRSSHRVTGLSPDQMIGRSPWDFAPSAYRTLAAQRFKETMTRFTAETPVEHDLWEMPLVNPDGDEHMTEISCSPFRNRADRIMGVQLVVTDITARRRLEDEREALLHEVQHRVRDNLQLVASLVRLSGPEHVDTRIATVSEVFDELYREKSFSRIKARPLLERVVAVGITTNSGCSPARITYTIDQEHLPMRTAVPLSLLVVEILRSMGEHPHQNPTLGVAFSTRGEALVLSLVCGSDLSDEEAASQGTLETMDKLPDENGIIGILTGQLRGDCRILRTESSILYTVSFVPERLVP